MKEGKTEIVAQFSKELARFVVEVRIDEVPDRVLHEARRSLLNFLGCAIGGSRDAAIEHAAAVLSRFSGRPTATVIGRSQRMDALNAAFLNAASANVFDFDDTHVPSVIHPTAPVAAALLALSELQRTTGRDLLLALVLGVEVACRVGNAVSPAHYRRGWHITSTCGVFGAAAASGKLLGLDSRRMNWALGCASAQSSGLVETLGTMAKSVGVGNAARNGLLSALLAQRGVTGPDRPLEGPRGFARVMGEEANLSALVDGLGKRWEILSNTYKPYPCGVVLNPVIDGCLELRARHGIPADRIARVVVRGHPLLAERVDRPQVVAGREAQVSAQHSVAVCFLFGTAGIREFSDAAAQDHAVAALRERVAVTTDIAMPVGSAAVSVAMDKGITYTTTIAHARGSLERPLTDDEIEAKVRLLAEHGLPGMDVEQLVNAVWTLDQREDAGDILRLAVPAARRESQK
jgi:2-methylcitrate dehydratase PrpD